MARKKKFAVVLLSGGLDSATTLYISKKDGYTPYVLSFDYSQRHKKELKYARLIAASLGAPIKIVKLDLPWKNSALLNKNIPLPKNRKVNSIPKDIPSTYVPARNIIFLSIAAGFAESIGAEAIYIGANAIDYSGYPDCRKEFFEAMKKAFHFGTKSGLKKGLKIKIPLLKMSKGDIVRIGIRLKVPFEFTWSCYGGGGKPCGKCDSCILRKKGFKDAGVQDMAFDR